MKKKKILSAVIIVLIPLIILGCMAAYRYFYKRFEQQLYPLPEEYLSCIEKYSDEYNVPIELICAVIRTESSFNPSARSHADAIGIMQITEPTFNWLQYKMQLKDTIGVDALFDYETNIKFGTYFLSLLYDEFQSYDTALAAYNAGRGSVIKWLEDPEISKDGMLINIPYEETANYIKKVNKAKIKYKELYFSPNTLETTNND